MAQVAHRNSRNKIRILFPSCIPEIAPFALGNYDWKSFVGFSDNRICPGHDIFFHSKTLAIDIIA